MEEIALEKYKEKFYKVRKVVKLTYSASTPIVDKFTYSPKKWTN